MKNAERMGALIGSVAGAVGTGVAVYLTGSPWCCLIALAGAWIGKLVAGGKA